MYCCPLWINSTSSSSEKLKASYNGVLRRLLLIVKPYSASEMFVTHKSHHFTNYYANVSIASGSAYLIVPIKLYRLVYLPSYLSTLQSDNGGDQYCINFNIFFFSLVIIIYILNICILYVDV